MLALALATALATPSTPALAAWFDRGRCTPITEEAPFARNADEQVVGGPSGPSLRPQNYVGYWYDARHGVAARLTGDVTGDFSIRATSRPPRAVTSANLANVSLTSGVRIGTQAATAVRLLGRPLISNKCGATYYSYEVDRGVGGNPLIIVIRNGRVVEIDRYYGD